ncbi:MAG: hypothetical protein F6K11_13715 [Leptolyngbya sp. SIO3F4]|nr:hypothetical protein [Leptolyngbya sp. SIO3F4]
MDRASLLKFARYAVYAVLVCSLCYVLLPMDPLAFQPTIIKIILQQLTILLFMALFLERALEVYKLSYLSPEKERLGAQVDYCQSKLDSISSDTDGSISSEILQTVQLDLFNAEEHLRVYRTHVRRNLLQTAIIFGFLIGLVGVRSLEGIVYLPKPDSTLEEFRFYLFRVLDLLLTAGLVAGGSEGIHGIIKQLNNLFPDIPQKVIELVRLLKQNSV